MTTKAINTYYSGGFYLASNYSNLLILPKGGVAGVGVVALGYATVTNYGRVTATTYFTGYSGVSLTQGGKVVNGGDPGHYPPNALISGHIGVRAVSGVGAVSNFGTIVGYGGAGVDLYMGDSVTNGGATDKTAQITGYSGILTAGAASTVTNFGTIVGLSPDQFGVYLAAGGAVTNGTALDTGASIEGYLGVRIAGAGGSVGNLGTITADGYKSYGVQLAAAGSVKNGSQGDGKAVIEGATGVELSAAGAVANYGTIDGAVNYGVKLAGYGEGLSNGAHGARSALIEGGSEGVLAAGGAESVNNAGTIVSTAGIGVDLRTTGGGRDAPAGAMNVLVNGSLNNATSLIEGYVYGVVLIGAATATNYGTIRGTGPKGSHAVGLYGAELLTNESSGLITGYEGVYVFGTGASTVTNFGTIIGAGGTALALTANIDVLVVETGSAFVGAVLGGGGTLDLASGVGKISNLGGGNVTVSGSMAATTFQAFGTVEIGAGARFTDTGAVTIAAGQAVDDAGSLTLGGSGKNGIVNAGLIETTGAGVLTLKGAVTGKGSVRIGGGTFDLTSSFTQNVTFSGTTGVLELAQSQGYTGTITGFSKTGTTSLDLNDIAFGGSTTATYSGTSKSGTLTVTDGTHTANIKLIGDYTASTFIASSDGHGGTIVVDPKAKAAAAPPLVATTLPFIAAASSFGAGAAGPAISARETWWDHPPILARPATMIA